MAQTLILVEEDYATYARTTTLTDLKGLDSSRLTRAERAAEEEIYSYLSDRFDMDQVFPTIYAWDATTPFTTDQRAAHLGIFYQAKTDNNNKPPAANTDDWEVDDPRNPMIVRYMVVISLYQVYHSLHGKNVPTHIREEYDLAKDWLLRVAKGQLNPKLPKLDADGDGLDDVSVIGGGSLSRQNYMYGGGLADDTDHHTDTDGHGSS
ncbi:MAG: hypothetical protein RIC30_09425 [Marinoscillum sp.]|uniref:hypothetical protein n=1 Tax=Marinoscillum sp. TaxID=2024838 RepID=UPI0032FCF4F6